MKEQVEEKVETKEIQEAKTERRAAVNPRSCWRHTPPEAGAAIGCAEAQLPAPETTAPQMPKADVAEIAAAPVQGPPPRRSV